jgi:hypothetical protein
MPYNDKEPEVQTTPWPYSSWKKKLEAKKEELPERKTEPFYPDYLEDVLAGI